MADTTLPQEIVYQLKVTLQYVTPPVWRQDVIEINEWQDSTRNRGEED